MLLEEPSRPLCYARWPPFHGFWATDEGAIAFIAVVLPVVGGAVAGLVVWLF
jgi:hypothetical protein